MLRHLAQRGQRHVRAPGTLLRVPAVSWHEAGVRRRVSISSVVVHERGPPVSAVRTLARPACSAGRFCRSVLVVAVLALFAGFLSASPAGAAVPQEGTLRARNLT